MENIDSHKFACAIAQFLDDKLAKDITILNISNVSSLADYFVIATVSSGPHWQGLYKEIKDYIKDTDLEIHKIHNKTSQGNDWNLIDLGPIVVHLMSQEARDFYELEKLWHAGKKIM